MRTHLLILLSLALLSTEGPLPAQEISRHEVGVGYGVNGNTAGAEIPVIVEATMPQRYGLGAPQIRYTFNLSRNVALESSYSESLYGATEALREGGRQTVVLGGIKAGIRKGRFGFFGMAAAGAASYACGEHEIYPQDFCTRETHFALQEGAAVEYSLSRRTFVRVDAAEFLTAQFRKVYQFYSNGFPFSTSFAGVPHHFDLAVSVSRRFGRLQELPAAPESVTTERQRGFSVGGLYMMGVESHLLFPEVRADGGGGAWLGFPLLPGRAGRYLSADLVAMDQPHDDHTANAQDGGTTFRAFLGPKLGFRKGPVGIYVKARPGIVRFSRTEVADVVRFSQFYSVEHPKIDFALDTGLVLDYTPPSRALRHALLRFEGGSNYIHYNLATTTVQGIPQFGTTVTEVYYAAPQRHATLLFLTGLGYRF